MSESIHFKYESLELSDCWYQKLIYLYRVFVSVYVQREKDTEVLKLKL